MIFTCVIIGIVFQGLIYERHTHYISDPATDHAVSAEDQNLVITVPADGLAPNSARPSADTVLTTKIDIISQSLLTVMKDVSGAFSLEANAETTTLVPSQYFLFTATDLKIGCH